MDLFGSDSDESDDDNIIFPRSRTIRLRISPYDEYDDLDVYKRFRFTKPVVRWIEQALLPYLTSPSACNYALTPVQNLCLALRFFATGSFQSMCGDTLMVSQSSASRAIRRTIDGITDRLFGHFVKWSNNPQYYAESTAAFQRIAGIPGVVGAIDCTHVWVYGPGTGIQFINRKNWTSINCQAVCNADGLFLNIVAKFPGSTHDSHIMRTSSVWRDFEHNGRAGILVGDSGYPCRPWLITPFLRPYPNLPCEKNFNDAQISTRCVIERSFGQLKRRFPCLQKGLAYHPDVAFKIFAACTTLHNIAVLQRLPHFRPMANNPNAAMLPQPPVPIPRLYQVRTGPDMRQHLAVNYS